MTRFNFLALGIAFALLTVAIFPFARFISFFTSLVAFFGIGRWAWLTFAERADPYSLEGLRKVHDREEIRQLENELPKLETETYLCPHCTTVYSAALGVCPQCRRMP